jgi:hypothetical protein
MITTVSVVSDWKTADKKLISDNCLKSIARRIEAVLNSSHHSYYCHSLKVYLTGRGHPCIKHSGNEVGTVNLSILKPEKGDLQLQITLIGAGAAFYVKPERDAEFFISGPIKRVIEKRKWYMPWKKIIIVDRMDPDCVFMLINTDEGISK